MFIIQHALQEELQGDPNHVSESSYLKALRLNSKPPQGCTVRISRGCILSLGDAFLQEDVK